MDLTSRVVMDLPAGAELRVTMPVHSPVSPPGSLEAACAMICNAPQEALHRVLLGPGVDIVRLNERLHGVLYHGFRRYKKRALGSA